MLMASWPDNRYRGNSGPDALHREHHNHDIGHAAQGAQKLPFGTSIRLTACFGSKEDQQGGHQRADGKRQKRALNTPRCCLIAR